MFGFMRNRSCEQHSQQLKANYRLHYCGTCKTMGALYGQRVRPLLNFDTVFLSELLAALGNEQHIDWNESYQAKSCFQLPKQVDDMPLSLQYAATVNVLLAELKVEDNRQEGAKLTSSLIQKLYSTAFQKAEAQMQTWGLDTQLLWTEMQTQASIEKHYTQLTDFAAPTAKMTALIFEKGAELVGTGHCPVPTTTIHDAVPTTTLMHQFGKTFGEIIYWLDALEDYERDFQQQKFNGIRAKYGLDTKELPNYYRLLVVKMLSKKEKEIYHIFEQMPLSMEISKAFCNRFSFNLATKLKPQSEKESIFSFEWEAIKHGWKQRKEAAFAYAQHRIEVVDSWQHQVQFNAWILVAFVAPNVAHNMPAPEPDKHSLTFWAVLTGFLAALGLGRKAAKTCKHGKHTYIKKMMNNPTGAKDPCGDCFMDCANSCCQACIQSCCETVCQSCCDSLCDSCCDDCWNDFRDAWSDTPWLRSLTIVLGSAIVLAGIIMLLIYLL